MIAAPKRHQSGKGNISASTFINVSRNGNEWTNTVLNLQQYDETNKTWVYKKIPARLFNNELSCVARVCADASQYVASMFVPPDNIEQDKRLEFMQNELEVAAACCLNAIKIIQERRAVGGFTSRDEEEEPATSPVLSPRAANPAPKPKKKPADIDPLHDVPTQEVSFDDDDIPF